MKAIEFIIIMISGAVAFALLFVGWIVGLAACVVGGVGMIGLLVSSLAYSSTHKLVHWTAMMHTGQLTAAAVCVVIIAWFGPVWLFQDRPQPVRR